MPLALTRRQLDVAGCDTPNCGHDHSVLFLTGRCHQRGVEAKYVKATGEIEIRCRVCKKPVVNVAVAGG